MPPPTGSRPSEPTNEPIVAPDAGMDSPYPSPVTYQRKYTRCHKLTCRRCAEGPGHGPYWYAFWWENGRTRTRYLGKNAPEAALAANPEIPADTSIPPPTWRVTTLGSFVIERDGVTVPDTAWPRR